MSNKSIRTVRRTVFLIIRLLVILLKDQGPLLASMTAYVEELTENKVTEKSPRRLLKMLLMGGYMDKEGLVTNHENEKSLFWKDVKRFNASQSMNLVESLTPSVEKVKIGEIAAITVPELLEATN